MSVSSDEIKEKLEKYKKEVQELFPDDPNCNRHNEYIQRKEREAHELITNYKNTRPETDEAKEIETQLQKILEDIQERLHPIEFVNRLNEMQLLIKDKYCPLYSVISAPAGYGKSRLIEAIRNNLQKQKWLCIHLELSREKSYSIEELTYYILQQLEEKEVEKSDLTEPRKAGYEIGKCILKVLDNAHKNVLILLDNAESVKKELAEQLLNHCILAIREGLSIVDPPIQLRLICAGRYLSHWKQWGSKLPLEFIPLTPFDFPAVYDTVEKFSSTSRVKSSLEYKQEFAAHLMYFTGGHPGCMAAILLEDFGYPIPRINSNKKDYYDTIVMPVIQEIKANIPDNLEEIFDTLSVVRRLNPLFLRRLIDKELIKWPQNKTEYELEEQLLRTHLVHKKNSFLGDNIARRLLAICLRTNNLNRFIRVCEESISFYASKLEDPQSHRPDIIAVELLFQKFQHLVYKKHNISKELFFESLVEILNTLVVKRSDPRSVMDSFIERLNEDWEFRFIFNYLLRDGIYDDTYPFEELIGKAVNFMKGLQGGNHA